MCKRCLIIVLDLNREYALFFPFMVSEQSKNSWKSMSLLDAKLIES